jgi:hypothetical protein
MTGAVLPSKNKGRFWRFGHIDASRQIAQVVIEQKVNII